MSSSKKADHNKPGKGRKADGKRLCKDKPESSVKKSSDQTTPVQKLTAFKIPKKNSGDSAHLALDASTHGGANEENSIRNNESCLADISVDGQQKRDKIPPKFHKDTRHSLPVADASKQLNSLGDHMASINTNPVRQKPNINRKRSAKIDSPKLAITQKRGCKRKSDQSPENKNQQTTKLNNGPENIDEPKYVDSLSGKSVKSSLTKSYDLPNNKRRPQKSISAKSEKLKGINDGVEEDSSSKCLKTLGGDEKTLKRGTKRGAKSKNVQEFSFNESEEKDVPAKSSGRRRGKKPVNYTEEDAGSEGEKFLGSEKASAAKSSGRRRGRKLANYTEEDGGADSGKSVGSETPKDRPRRGRRSNISLNLACTEDEGEEKEVPAAKPRRGRKPKAVPDSLEERSKGKTGRGRKTAAIKGLTCDEDAEEELKCSHCELVCESNSKMKSHYASVHTLLYSKANPEGADDLQSLRKICKLLGGKLVCKSCNKSLKTPGYYKQHVQWCNSDKTLMAKCQHCGKEYKEFWMHSHELTCLKKQAETEARELKERDKKKSSSPTSATDGKRKAAKKAMSVIKNISNEKEEAFDWKSMVRVPPMTVPSEEVLKEWQRCEDMNETLTCAHADCTVQHNSVEQMTEHYWTCVSNGLKSHTWNCKICAKKFHSEDKAVSHAKMTHGAKKRKIKEDDEYRSDGASASDNDDITSGDPTDEEGDGGGTELEDESDADKPRSRNVGRDMKSYFYSSYPIRPTFSIKKLCESLHTSTPPRIAHLLPNVNLAVELHKGNLFEGKVSLKFRLGSLPETHQLRVEQTVCHTKTNSSVAYVGEPIRLMACCPMDRQTEQTILSGDQFYAIISANDKSFQDIKETYSSPGAISIWRIANLESKADPISITLYLNLTHNLGHIHQLRWCYDGGFVQSQGNLCSRLGLLALASSDGCVHIVSVPFLPPKQDNLTGWTYPVVDNLKLAVQGNSAQCTCVDWQRQDTKMVVAGFNDGSVAIWYVDGDMSRQVLHPIKVFRSHPSLMTAVAWCPYNSNMFATFSYGWFIWDMKDLSAPYFTPKVSEYGVDLNTRAVWSRIHHVAITCADPSFGSPSVMVTGIGYDCIASNQKYPVRDLLYSSDCDVCDCCDYIAVSDSSGTVGWHDKILPKYEKGGEKHCVKSDAVRTFIVDEEAGADVQFRYLLKERQKPQVAKSNLCDPRVLMENDRTHSIDAVSLNPNAAGHGWLFCGGKHGLLHMINLNS